MWGVWRLVRAMRVFALILGSYLLQLGLQRLATRLGRGRLEGRWERVHVRNARRLYRGIVRLRGVYIKLGQVLSIMGTFLPRAYATELEKLQDEVPAHPFRDVARSIERALGAHPDALYEEFQRAPLAAASLAQVHKARAPGGAEVAVKVLYPNVATIIAVDMRVLSLAVRVLGWFLPVQQLQRVHEQLEDMLRRETDLAHEAACMTRMAANFEDDPDVLFPAPLPDLSAPTVLTMTFMEGVKISRKEDLAALGLEPKAVATKLVQSFYKQLFLDRFFHADPHPGNFFVQRGPQGQARLVVLDFGAASEVSDALVDGMLHILAGYMTRNDDLVVQGIERMGFVAPGGDRALLVRTTRKYFAKLLALDIQDFGKIEGETLVALMDLEVRRDDLREVMRAITYPPGWFFVERAVVILFGLAAHLAPTLNTVQVGFPYIMQLLKTHRMPFVPSARTPVAAAPQATAAVDATTSDGTTSDIGTTPRAARG